MTNESEDEDGNVSSEKPNSGSSQNKDDQDKGNLTIGGGNTTVHITLIGGIGGSGGSVGPSKVPNENLGGAVTSSSNGGGGGGGGGNITLNIGLNGRTDGIGAEG